MHPNNGSILFDLPVSRFGKEGHFGLAYEILRTKYKELSLAQIYLMRDEQAFTTSSWDENVYNNFVNNEGRFTENLYATLLLGSIDSTNVTKVEEFCQKHHMKFLKQIKINFLTGQITIDVISNNLETIGEVKRQIKSLKGIPPHLQMLYHDEKVELSDETMLAFLNKSMLHDCITFDLIVKPVKEIELNILCNFLKDKEEFQVTVLETDTLGRLKEIISGKVGIPPMGFNVVNSHDSLVPESFPIHDCFFQNNTAELRKRLLVSITNNAGAINDINYSIRDYERDTVQVLVDQIQREHSGGQSSISLIKSGLNKKTLLKDVGDMKFTFVLKRNKDSNCTLL